MRATSLRAAAFAAGVVCVIGWAQADIVWDESADGDLPDLYRFSDPHSPTNTCLDLGALPLGVSTLLGTNIQQSSGAGNLFEGDAVRFTVPDGFELAEIIFSHDRAAGLREFLKVSGTSTLETYVFRTFPAYHLPIGTQQLIGYAPIDPPPRPPIVPGGDPLGPGEYVLSWDNATFNTTMNYSIDIVLIPAPGALGLLGLAALAMRRRR